MSKKKKKTEWGTRPLEQTAFAVLISVPLLSRIVYRIGLNVGVGSIVVLEQTSRVVPSRMNLSVHTAVPFLGQTF